MDSEEYKPRYKMQYNKRDDTVTVFDANERWVGVFRNETYAYKFITLVLRGELDDK